MQDFVKSAQIGGRTEVQALGRLLDTARAGASAGVVVIGAAGLGKTSLLAEVETMATDFAILRARAVEFESRMPFAALQHLLAPRLPLLPTLPGPLRAALEMAFGLRPGQVDPFKVGLGVVALLAVVAPTLCLIDDAHHLDPLSAEALVLATRRLGHEPVTVVLLARPDHGVAALDELPHLPLTPLLHDGARRLLSSTLGAPLDTAVRDQILGEARGIPAAIAGIAGCVRTAAALAGGYALPGIITPPRPLMDDYKGRLDGLAGPAQSFALLAASDPTGDPALLWRAAQSAGVEEHAAAAADAVSMTIGRRVTFAHPLARSAVYHWADASQRRASHDVLAAATDAANAPDRRAWHRGQAAIGPDEDVSRELEANAKVACRRGGFAAGAAFLERAAALSAHPARRFHLTIDAAAVKLDAGDVDAAAALTSAARLDATDEMDAMRLDALDAQSAFAKTWRAEEARGLVAAAHRLATRKPGEGAPIWLQALVAAYWTGHGTDLTDEVSVINQQASEPDGAGFADLAAVALSSAMFGDRAAAVPQARRAVDALSEDAAQLELCNPASAWITCSIAWDDHALARILDEQVAVVRDTGRVGALPVTLASRALVHMHAGELGRAAECVAEAKKYSDVVPELVELGVAAWRGDRRTADQLCERLSGSATLGPRPMQLAAVAYARLLINNATGNYREALAAAEASSGLDELWFHVFIPPELVEAAALGGRMDKAVELSTRLGRHTEAAGTPWALGVHRRCQALVAGESDAEELFTESIGQLRASRTPIQLARSHMLFGEWLRRRQRRSEARVHLREAFDAFSVSGAALFAKRASRELRAAGEMAPQPRSRRGELSDQELEVAERVADGKTSKEVAAELVLSPRTVDAHLRSIFSKLGVKSRREIRHALPSTATSQSRPGPVIRHAPRCP
ncbi:helix-turn-helix transcriptional regulator [Mycolicibacterium sediminis]|nr:LuxR family transcriptional regulator [Mycolicibacterium sediminis]